MTRFRFHYPRLAWLSSSFPRAPQPPKSRMSSDSRNIFRDIFDGLAGDQSRPAEARSNRERRVGKTAQTCQRAAHCSTFYRLPLVSIKVYSHFGRDGLVRVRHHSTGLRTGAQAAELPLPYRAFVDVDIHSPASQAFPFPSDSRVQTGQFAPVASVSPSLVFSFCCG